MPLKQFGEIAVEEGFTSLEVIASALLQQEMFGMQGERKLIGQILLEQEKLSNRQIIQILQRQKKVILVCAQCETLFNIINKESGKDYSCLMCGGTLQFPRTAMSTAIAGEIQGELVRKSVKSKGDFLQNLGTSILAEYEKAGQSGEGIEKPAKYHIQRELARGGMGTIYAAMDNDLKREVAIKFLKEGPFAAQAEKDRFIREFQITAGVQHPNIIPVYEVGRNGGELYYSMKLIQGQTLRQILDSLLNKANSYVEEYRKGRLMRIFLSVCHGVGFAHSKRVIHRDLKPENIMVGDFGEVVVMDWGLSTFFLHKTKTLRYSSHTEFKQVLEQMEGPEGKTEFLGTPNYMSPEQLSGSQEFLDHRSDIFSLGILLYELLTLKLPSTQTEFSAIIQEQIQADFFPPKEINRKIPKALSDICVKALSRSPEDRFSCVYEMIEEMESLLEKRTAIFK
ncbi:MAG: serine/threonine-protein kinase [Planctomycetota bacterium]